ncbi:unnamed protein product [Calypogeia fissa]
MTKWSGCISGTVAVPVDKVWEIAQFGELHKWDSNAIESCDIKEGNGCSSGSIRCVVFKYRDGTTGSLVERLTYYNAEDYTYRYEMDDNPLGYEGYSCIFSLDKNDDGTTTVKYSFELDPIQHLSEEEAVGGIGKVFRRRISLLEDAAGK